jgi:imidazolonepropionase
MRAHGVTSIEIKSGYGLTVEDELRILGVARRVGREAGVRVSATLLGAHAVPAERKDDRAGYVRDVCEQMIPRAAAARLADAVDVYCDENAFTLDETRAVLDAAVGAGLAVRAHVGQFRDLGGADLVASRGGLSCDHLEDVGDAGLAAMARAGTVAVLLPGAWRTLRQTPPDAARMRAAGVRVAIGTDCNPGTSPCTDLPLCVALAVRDAGVTLDEAILGVTAVAARAAGLRDVGVIAPGAHADLAVYPFGDPRALAYALGDVRATAVLVGGVPMDPDTVTPSVW